MVPTFRGRSEPCLADLADEVDCRKISLEDLVTAKNEKNKMLKSDHVDCENNLVEPGLDAEGTEDDWFSKLSSRGENSSHQVLPFDGLISDGINCTEIPLIYGDDLDFKEKTMRTFRRGMKKIWKRGSATITQADPTNKVVYLGNVLTGWAKGEGCIEKPLHTLWKNYSSSTKLDVHMKITVTQSGLKAVTKDHGLTEYWSHRITYCCAPANIPRVFCWVYRHEGRKLKQELRCHAVLCSKESTAQRMATTLRLRLTQALTEFKRDKLLKQNARLSLVNSVYDNPSLPRRKILLSIGSQNYRPPLERSKSAPKLMSIEESLEEEDSSPKTKRKPNGNGESNATLEVGEISKPHSENSKKERQNLNEKSDFKITNLNFVKKLCSSIENLVGNTSNYGKKLLTDRRLTAGCQVTHNVPEDSVLEKTSCFEEYESEGKRLKVQKNVTFEGEKSDLKKRESDASERKEQEKCDLAKKRAGFVFAVKDHESDESSNSLQSLSSWSSDFSSLMTSSSERSVDEKAEDAVEKGYLEDLQVYKTSMERLYTYLNSCGDVYVNEGKVVLHPTGEGDLNTSVNEKETFSLTRIDSEEVDSLSEDDGGQQEEEVVSDESGYVELADHMVKRLSLDKKNKDIPYHRIIKSNLLRPGRFEPCLQV